MTAIADLLEGKTEGEWCERELREEVRELVAMVREVRMSAQPTQSWWAWREYVLRGIP